MDVYLHIHKSFGMLAQEIDILRVNSEQYIVGQTVIMSSNFVGILFLAIIDKQ